MIKIVNDHGTILTPLHQRHPMRADDPKASYVNRNMDVLLSFPLAISGIELLAYDFGCTHLEFIQLSENQVFSSLSESIKRYSTSKDYVLAVRRLSGGELEQAEAIQHQVELAAFGLSVLADAPLNGFERNQHIFYEGMKILKQPARHNIQNIIAGLDLIYKSYLIEEINPAIILCCQASYLDECNAIARRRKL